MKKLVSVLLCIAMLLSLACVVSAETEETTAPEIVWDENKETILLEYGATYGEGEKSFQLVVDHLNQVVVCTVNTDEETVGAALAALNIVAGEDSDYGLMVNTIDGYTADYNVDGTYWAFYINGDYAMTGVDSTPIEDDTVYTFKVDGAEVEEGATISLVDGKHYGVGEKSFALVVTDAEGNEVSVTVHTDEETIGAALAALNIVAGDDSDFGLYIKTVNNVTADYDTDGKYWAFYIDGEYAMTGVDATEIQEGSTYSLKVEG